MGQLIGRARDLIGDPAGASQEFTDQRVQDALDCHQTVVRYASLSVGASIGSQTYLDYYAGQGDWESDEKLFDGGGALLSPSEADRLTGRWSFAASTPPPVYLLGKTYDMYAAAADLLDQWAAKLSRSYDFAQSGRTFSRSQMPKALRAQADQYRAQARPVFVRQVRDDVAV